MPSVRITGTDNEGKQHQIALPVGRYTPEQAKEITIRFRQWLKEDKTKKEFMEKYNLVPGTFSLFAQSSDTTTSGSTPPPIQPQFESCDVLNLTLPTNGGCSWLLVGSTRSGKSTLMIKLWETYFKSDITILNTLSSQVDIYKPLKKKAVIAQAFFPELVHDTMIINRDTKNHYKFCWIYDDMALDGKNSQELTKLLTIGRNSNQSVLYCAQRLEMMNPTGRTNCNYVCCFRLNTDSAIEDVVKTYLRSYFPSGLTVPEMIRLYKELTADHHFFFINTLEDTVHRCKIAV